MRAYYTCIIDCNRDDANCRDSCAIRTLNTTIAEFANPTN